MARNEGSSGGANWFPPAEQVQESHDPMEQGNNTHPAFAAAEEVVRAAHAAYMRHLNQRRILQAHQQNSNIGFRPQGSVSQATLNHQYQHVFPFTGQNRPQPVHNQHYISPYSFSQAPVPRQPTTQQFPSNTRSVPSHSHSPMSTQQELSHPTVAPHGTENQGARYQTVRRMDPYSIPDKLPPKSVEPGQCMNVNSIPSGLPMSSTGSPKRVNANAIPSGLLPGSTEPPTRMDVDTIPSGPPPRSTQPPMHMSINSIPSRPPPRSLEPPTRPSTVPATISGNVRSTSSHVGSSQNMQNSSSSSPIKPAIPSVPTKLPDQLSGHTAGFPAPTNATSAPEILKKGRPLSFQQSPRSLGLSKRGSTNKRPSDFVQPLNIAHALAKDSYDPSTIARDVLINADKHPTEKCLNHHLEILRTSLQIDLTSDLSSLRWDRIDEDALSRDTKSDCQPARTPDAHPSNDKAPKLGHFVHASTQSHPRPLPNTELPFPPPPFALPPSPSSRPPSLPPHTNSSSAVVPPPPAPPAPHTKTPAPKLTHKFNSETLIANPTSASPPRPKTPSHSPRHNNYPQAQVIIPASNMPPRKKRAGQAKKASQAVEVAITQKPATEYAVFHCEWSNCQAELHNLNSIQSHVLKVHIPHHIQCAWKNCNDSTPRAAADMWDHVRDKHISALAWALGDGPFVPAPTDEKSATPLSLSSFSLFGPSPRPGTIILPADNKLLSTYNRIHGISATRQKAEVFKDGGCHWKEEAGPESDLSDRRLSTPNRLCTSKTQDIAYTLAI